MRAHVPALSLLLALAGAPPLEAEEPLRSGNVVRGAVLRVNSSGTWLPDPTRSAVRRAASPGKSRAAREERRGKKGQRAAASRARGASRPSRPAKRS